MRSRETVKPRERAILIADPDRDFLNTFRTAEVKAIAPGALPVTAPSGHVAQEMIADPKRMFLGIFVNLDLENPSAVSVIRCAYYHRPATPVYVLQDGKPSTLLEVEDLSKLGIRKLLQKPVTYADMVKLVAPIAISFDAERVLNSSYAADDGFDPSQDSHDYLPLRAEDFLSGARSLFDIYVRLNTGRYVKLLKAGDSFTAARIESYLIRGVTHFFIRKEAQEDYLRYCDYLASNLLQTKKAPADMKVRQMLNFGEQTMNFLKNQGVGDANLQYAEKFISNLSELVLQLRLERETEISDFISNVAAYEHGVGTAVLAGILAKHIEIKFEKPLHAIGLASLLHDIGLYQLPKELWHEDEALMSPEQLEQYKTHPMVSAQLIRKLRAIASGVTQTVNLHHFRKKGRGFPSEYPSVTLSKSAEIVGICDEFHTLIRRALEDPSFDLLDHLERETFPGFSTQIVYAFRSCFLGKKPGKK
ncbi:MAG: HD domain-containing phosphohydrolase [Bdellovibrionota bacterium]